MSLPPTKRSSRALVRGASSVTDTLGDDVRCLLLLLAREQTQARAVRGRWPREQSTSERPLDWTLVEAGVAVLQFDRIR